MDTHIIIRRRQGEEERRIERGTAAAIAAMPSALALDRMRERARQLDSMVARTKKERSLNLYGI